MPCFVDFQRCCHDEAASPGIATIQVAFLSPPRAIASALAPSRSIETVSAAVFFYRKLMGELLLIICHRKIDENVEKGLKKTVTHLTVL